MPNQKKRTNKKKIKVIAPCGVFGFKNYLRRLDGDTSVLFILTGVGEAGLTGAGTGDDPSL